MKTYRIAVAGLLHETITFWPGRSTLDDFLRTSHFGQEVITQLADTNTGVSGFLDVLGDKNVEVIPLFWCTVDPFQTVAEEAYDFFAGKLREGLEATKGDLDGVLLDLHGAMATEKRQDPDTDLVALARDTIGDQVPLMVTLDMHANKDKRIIDLADGVFGYQSSPHIDMDNTGRRAASALWRMLQGEITPVTAIKRPGIVVPSLLSATDLHPAKTIIERVHYWMSKPGVVDATALFGFAWCDVETIGMSMIAVTNNDKELAEKITEDLCQLAIELKDELVGTKGSSPCSVEDGVKRAIEKAKSNTKPVLIVDHADRSSDTTFVLRELLKQHASNVAIPSFYDPSSARACVEAGLGNTIELEIGGHTGWRDGGKLRVTGKILWCGEGRILGTGPMSKNKKVNLGSTAIIDVEGLWIQLVSKFRFLMDEDPITQFGWKVNDFDIIVTKSKTHWRAGLEPIISESIIVDAPGQCPVDLGVFEYDHRPQT